VRGATSAHETTSGEAGAVQPVMTYRAVRTPHWLYIEFSGGTHELLDATVDSSPPVPSLTAINPRRNPSSPLVSSYATGRLDATRRPVCIRRRRRKRSSASTRRATVDSCDGGSDRTRVRPEE
jgi:hypothetical protein